MGYIYTPYYIYHILYIYIYIYIFYCTIKNITTGTIPHYVKHINSVKVAHLKVFHRSYHPKLSNKLAEKHPR